MEKIALCNGLECPIKELCKHYEAFMSDEGYDVPIRFIISKPRNCPNFLKKED